MLCRQILRQQVGGDAAAEEPAALGERQRPVAVRPVDGKAEPLEPSSASRSTLLEAGERSGSSSRSPSITRSRRRVPSSSGSSSRGRRRPLRARRGRRRAAARSAAEALDCRDRADPEPE
jgi:hypothetical protein